MGPHVCLTLDVRLPPGGHWARRSWPLTGMPRMPPLPQRWRSQSAQQQHNPGDQALTTQTGNQAGQPQAPLGDTQSDSRHQSEQPGLPGEGCIPPDTPPAGAIDERPGRPFLASLGTNEGASRSLPSQYHEPELRTHWRTYRAGHKGRHWQSEEDEGSHPSPGQETHPQASCLLHGTRKTLR